jgi:hypothetical protein
MVADMKTTEKIKLIRSISEKLSHEELSIVNLTLENFGIKEIRVGKKKILDVILKNISSASPNQLVDLANHLGIDLPEGESAGLSVWKKDDFRVFISHISSKKDKATDLRDVLEGVGISPFVAHQDIVPSTQWINAIDTALRTCDALVALMEKGFHKSNWTDHEVGFVYGRGLPVIPVDLGEKPYGIIAKIQACPFQGIDKLGETVFRLLCSDPRTSRKLSYAVMARFEQSNSFAAANVNLRTLRKLKYWDATLIERLRLAPRKNDQIKGSFDVPEGVQALLRKLKSIEMQ